MSLYFGSLISWDVILRSCIHPACLELPARRGGFLAASHSEGKADAGEVVTAHETCLPGPWGREDEFNLLGQEPVCFLWPCSWWDALHTGPLGPWMGK